MRLLELLVEAAATDLALRAERKLAKERTERKLCALFTDLIDAASVFGASAGLVLLLEAREVSAVGAESADCVLPRKKEAKLLAAPELEPSVLLLQWEISRPGEEAARRRLCIMLPRARSTLASPTVLYHCGLPVAMAEHRRRGVRGVRRGE